MEAAKTTASSAWDAIKTNVKSATDAIKTNAKTGFDAVKNTVQTAMNNVKTAISNVWNSIIQSIGGAMTNAYNAVVNGFKGIITFFTSLPQQAINWGRDLIQGFINGITGMFSALGSTIQNVASSVASFLHFSAPDEGPLADYETWMPDFMKGLAQGIEKSRGLVQAAVGDVAEDLLLSPNVTSAGAMSEAPGANDQSSTLIAMLSESLPYLPQLANMSMVTDTGALVGQLAPQMDQRLGVIAMRQRRQ